MKFLQRFNNGVQNNDAALHLNKNAVDVNDVGTIHCLTGGICKIRTQMLTSDNPVLVVAL